MSWCSSCEIWKMESLVRCLGHQRGENQTFSSSIIRIHLPPNCRPSEMSSPSSTKFIFQETLTESRDVYVSPTVRQIVWEIPFYVSKLMTYISNHQIKSHCQVKQYLLRSSTSIMWKIASRNNVLFLTQPIFQDKNLLLTFPFQIRAKFTFKMTLFQWIFCSLICLISAKKKPNILVILADDLGKNFILISSQIQTWFFYRLQWRFLAQPRYDHTELAKISG